MSRAKNEHWDAICANHYEPGLDADLTNAELYNQVYQLGSTIRAATKAVNESKNVDSREAKTETAV